MTHKIGRGKGHLHDEPESTGTELDCTDFSSTDVITLHPDGKCGAVPRRARI